MSWNLNAAPTTRLFNLTASEIKADPDGVMRTILVYNGQFPGPLVRVNQGDRLLVNVTNELPNSTTVHWHGLYQNGTNWTHGTAGITQCPIPPGRSFLCNFTIGHQFGTYWYHAHESTRADGLVGPLIVHSPQEAAVQGDYDFDQVVILQDLYHDLSASLLPGCFAPENENAEPVPDNGHIQGTNYFECSSYYTNSGYNCSENSTQATVAFAQHKIYRLRSINTGAFAEFHFLVDNHSLSVIEADSTLLQPIVVQRVPIGVAQRYSVILHTDQSSSAKYWMRARMTTGCFSSDNALVLNPDVRALITYTNTTYEPTASVDWESGLEEIREDLNATQLVPLSPLPAPSHDITYAIDVSFQIGAYAIDKAFVNTISWAPATVPALNQAVAGLHSANSSTFEKAGVAYVVSPAQLIANIPSYAIIDVLINSFDDDEGAQLFYLHSHQFWVMATGSLGVFGWEKYSDVSLNIPNPCGERL